MLRTLLVLLLACSGGMALHADAAPHRAAYRHAPQEEARVQAAMTVPDDLRKALAELRLDRETSDLDRVRRLFEFMVSDDGLALHYQEQPTYDVAGSYAQRKVNCLSFTMMFIALARASGVEAYAQASEDALAMDVVDDTVYRAKHIKAGIDVRGAQYTVDVGWNSIVAQRSPHAISDMQMVSLLRNNNAIERLRVGDGSGAMAEIEMAMALDPDSATIWNNAGVIHWRSGQTDDAEHAFLRTLELEDGHVGALGNLVGLYRSTGKNRLAARYEKRLQRVQSSDPFSQFLMAQDLMKLGAYDVAASHYRRAIRLLPNQPEFHRSLAEAYQMLGKDRAAHRVREHALSLEQRKYSRRSIPDAGPGSG